MQQTTKKMDRFQDLKSWMLQLEKATGEPVVISLLVEKGLFTFLSSQSKNHFFDAAAEPDAAPGEAAAKTDLKNIKIKSLLDNLKYIG